MGQAPEDAGGSHEKIDRLPAAREKRAKGLEPSTSSLGSSVPVVLRAGNTAFSSAGADGCTGGCTETDSRAEIIARSVELVAALNMSMTESPAVLRRLLRTAEEVPADATREIAEAALPFQATRKQHQGLAAARKQREGRMLDLRFSERTKSASNDGSSKNRKSAAMVKRILPPPRLDEFFLQWSTLQGHGSPRKGITRSAPRWQTWLRRQYRRDLDSTSLF